MSPTMDDPRVQAMIEAGARAIYCDSGWRPEGWETLTDEAKGNWRRHARACLTAALAAVPGLVVTEAPDEAPFRISDGVYATERRVGYNACRAAVLAKAIRIAEPPADG